MGKLSNHYPALQFFRQNKNVPGDNVTKRLTTVVHLIAN